MLAPTATPEPLVDAALAAPAAPPPSPVGPVLVPPIEPDPPPPAIPAWLAAPVLAIAIPHSPFAWGSAAQVAPAPPPATEIVPQILGFIEEPAPPVTAPPEPQPKPVAAAAEPSAPEPLGPKPTDWAAEDARAIAAILAAAPEAIAPVEIDAEIGDIAEVGNAPSSRPNGRDAAPAVPPVAARPSPGPRRPGPLDRATIRRPRPARAGPPRRPAPPAAEPLTASAPLANLAQRLGRGSAAARPAIPSVPTAPADRPLSYRPAASGPATRPPARARPTAASGAEPTARPLAARPLAARPLAARPAAARPAAAVSPAPPPTPVARAPARDRPAGAPASARGVALAPAAAAPPVAVPETRSLSQNRRLYRRVMLAAELEINGTPCRLVDLSIGGFAAGGAPPLPLNTIVPVTLRMTIDGIDIGTQLAARVVYANEARAAGRFVELTAAQTAFLRYVVTWRGESVGAIGTTTLLDAITRWPERALPPHAGTAAATVPKLSWWSRWFGRIPLLGRRRAAPAQSPPGTALARR